ncbi:HEAT repeat domain-containing protein [Limnofasciculus baicalensis]|uniref:HEAT repeat domain-containing protein n=1 Tax=Limnofasciculus baicalensis BBK-W-15 TaxID=2699891 RepID=A0AAE3GXK4_9CYAN|nr:HEAT repeat domain-containing protein [Limnofasciculus baicalensis]MCP2732445.1 HEAT repeat domain-containing protein [Limnofasciculus baicalensis BBK-W-15]
MLQSETQSESTPIQLSQSETDALLEAVKEQISLDTFDSNNQQLLKLMVESLGDTRGMVRLGFAQRLGEIGKPATPFLLDALANHTNVVVRRAAAKTLTLIGDPIAVPNLVYSLLHDEDTVVKGSSIGALARMGEASVPPLLEILASPDYPESTKGHAAWALAFIGAEAKDYLYQEIGSDSPEVRAAVVGAIAKIAQENPEEKAFNVLVNALTDSSANVRCEAAAVLGNLTYKPAIPHLIELLHHTDWESRKSAALALMKIGDSIALQPLNTALNQESEGGVQTVIKLAISQIERKSGEDDWE